ncbi:MAG: hypothetical protein U1D30_01085 [Planctomycetota bacterium]
MGASELAGIFETPNEGERIEIRPFLRRENPRRLDDDADLFAMLACVVEPPEFPFDVQADVAFKELNPDFCWFHPALSRSREVERRRSRGDQGLAQTPWWPTIIIRGSTARTDDLGKTWTKPAAIPELAWRKQGTDITVAVADTTPGWHAASQQLLVIGVKILYSSTGDYASLEKLSGSYETSYATFDPETN